MGRYGINHDIKLEDLNDEDKIALFKNLKDYRHEKITMGQLAEKANVTKMQAINLLLSTRNI